MSRATDILQATSFRGARRLVLVLSLLVTLPGAGLAQPVSPEFEDLVEFNGQLFFTARDGANGRELWMSDGTPEGTVLFKDIRPGPGASFPEELTKVGAALFFRADDGVNGEELWMSDGTPEGTVLVEDIVPGAGDSSPGQLTEVQKDPTLARELRCKKDPRKKDPTLARELRCDRRSNFGHQFAADGEPVAARIGDDPRRYDHS